MYLFYLIVSVDCQLKSLNRVVNFLLGKNEQENLLLGSCYFAQDFATSWFLILYYTCQGLCYLDLFPCKLMEYVWHWSHQFIIFEETSILVPLDTFSNMFWDFPQGLGVLTMVLFLLQWWFQSVLVKMPSGRDSPVLLLFNSFMKLLLQLVFNTLLYYR